MRRFSRMALTIGIYSGRGDLVRRLRDVSSSWAFVAEGEEREGCRVVIIDDDSHALLDVPPRKSLVRVVLCDGSMPATRRRGEIRVDRNAFLATASEYLHFASDLAETAIHASVLEQEVTYLAQIHDMMTMVEADAVSERIAVTVLDILGLDTGTL